MTTHTQKPLDQLLAFLNLYQLAKNQFIPFIHFWDIQSILESCDQTGHTYFQPCPTQTFLINFDNFDNFCELYQYAKNEGVSLHCSGETADLKILQYDWLRAFSNKIFPIYRICAGTANNMNFHYRTGWLKINDQIFLLIQKTLFLAHFPNFLGKKGFSKKSGSVTHIAPCQNSEKSNDPVLKNHPDRRQDGRTDRRYFIGPFQLLL